MFGYTYSWATHDIAVGRAPQSKSALKKLKKDGVEVIVNLCTECGELHQLERDAGFLVYWLPITDGLIPEIDELDECVSWLVEQVDAGRKALVHCRFGVGRSGTILAAYLLKRGLDLEQTMAKMNKMPAMPANRDQRKLVTDFAAKLADSSKTT